jgi:hypothetical protein
MENGASRLFYMIFTITNNIRRFFSVLVCLFVSIGVRGKPRMYCSMLAYRTARFGRSNFGHQMPPRLPTRSAL